MAPLRSTLALIAFLATPAVAGAQLPAPATGGTFSAPAPEVTRISCRSACAGTVAQTGSTLRLRGTNLDGVIALSFLGGVMPDDEVAAEPAKVRRKALTVEVPPGAATGPIMLAQRDGQTSTSPSVTIAETAEPEPTSGPIATAVTLRKAFVDGERAPTLAYKLNTAAPADVTVTVVRVKGDKVVATFHEGVVAPGETRVLSWGRRAGTYRFVVDAAGAGLTASTASAGANTFRVYGYKFPLDGKHDFGDGLGAGRGHQGTDVFAACDTPITAARGGTVKMKEFQSRAGNYLVVDEARSGYDSAYMHLRDPAVVEQGERVRTGQLLGYVGMTGAASECHLHFEYWTAPGWYSGGSPVDASSHLKAWDRNS